MDTTIRVLVANRPRLLRELVMSTLSEQAGGQAAEQKPAARGPWRGSGIVADNLDRVAATVEQILEVVNRDAGLMVELKRASAQNAGESGQILEESDLSENAVAERLREDLRTRVLATQLLGKYGYLVPKLNPDSDLAQEQRLVLQERAQELARAAERNYAPREQAPEAFANCDSQQKDCDLPQRTPLRTRRIRMLTAVKLFQAARCRKRETVLRSFRVRKCCVRKPLNGVPRGQCS